MARRRRRRKSRRKRGIRLKFPRNSGAFFIAALVLAVGFFWAKNTLKFHTPFSEKTHRKAVSPARKPAASKPPAARQLRWPVSGPAAPLKSQGRGPKLVFVIDDMGHTTEHLSQLDQLGNKVTYAILPFLKHSHFFDEYSYQTGAEVILHLPMESVSGTIPGPGLITSAMTDGDVRELVGRELDSLQRVKGANNHMGSKGTSDPRMMELILRELKNRNLFFLDSMTTIKSVSRDVGGEMSFGTILKRDVFLDNVDDLEKVRSQIRLQASIARMKGQAIGIGHYRYNTLQALVEEIPKLKKEGFDIVSLSELRRLNKK